MWNTLIRAHASSKNSETAIFLYMNMKRINFSPNEHTFPFVLKACSKITSLNCCKQIHNHVLKLGFMQDLHVGNALVRSYSVSNDLDNARKVFDEITDKNLNLWTTMISGYAQNFCSNEALLLFDEMISLGFEPNTVTLVSVLSACAQSGCLELGDKIRDFVKEDGIEMGIVLGTSLIHMYAKNGAISKAREMFDEMPERNIATWNAMICGLAHNGHAEEALNMFRELEKMNIVPDDATFVGVLSACCHAGMTEVGREVFESMKKVYDIEPKIEHYGCMVDLLGRCGKVEEAEEFMERMAWKADMVILGALLAACKNHGNVEVAERVVKRMIKLDPNNHGVFVVLSNLYAEVGKWEDVTRLRKLMKDWKLRKLPGWSVIDGDD